ncbi:MAG: SAM-dependent methyltransferase [Candidatus Riflebacteria bacterium]|nr:SAM-dependent methyltransferase [Candidatus Riflebacteria bacterium]
MSGLPPSPTDRPDRTVHCAEALAWLEAWVPAPDTSFISSLPDVSETPLQLEDWRSWFRTAAGLILARCPDHGVISFGRPAYSHMLCFSRAVRPVQGLATPDVLPGTGTMIWARGMGVNAAILACRWALEHAGCRTVIDPLCGHGTVLAAANAHGIAAIGVDLSARRCRQARALQLSATTAG